MKLKISHIIWHYGNYRIIKEIYKQKRLYRYNYKLGNSFDTDDSRHKKNENSIASIRTSI